MMEYLSELLYMISLIGIVSCITRKMYNIFRIMKPGLVSSFNLRVLS